MRRSASVLLLIFGFGCLGCESEPEYGGKSLSQWSELLHDEEPEIRHQAAMALRMIGPESRAVLEEAIQDADPAVRAAAAEAMAGVGAEALTPLTSALEDADPAVRGAAAVSLGSLGKPAIPALTQAVADQDENVRTIVIGSLGRVGPDAIDVLAEAMNDPNPMVASAAVTAMASSGSAAVVKLIGALERAETREAAVVALGRIGPSAKPSLTSLAKTIRDPELKVRLAVVTALEMIDPRAAIPILKKAQDDETIRDAASAVLGRIDPEAKAAAETAQ